MTIDCDKPNLQGDNYADLVEAFVERGAAIKACNLQLQSIRELNKSED